MPLPKPRINENESDFIQRCVVDPTMVSEYRNDQQRIAVCYNLYENKGTKKDAEQEWLNGWDKQLDIAERQEVVNVKRYYLEQYNEAIRIFKQTRQTKNFETIFKRTDIYDLYADMYFRISMRFANYFRKNYALLFKQIDTSGYDDIWKNIFSNLGLQIGQRIAPALKETTDKTLDKELTRFLNDPDLIKLNERDAARIITTRFANIAEYQAKRIVRTEATYAANIGTQQSARDTFGKDELEKKWKTSFDERVRGSHAELHNTTVNYDELFSGIMFVPGDRTNGASAADVINCRCRVIYKPKAGIMESEKLTPEGARQVQEIIREFI